MLEEVASLVSSPKVLDARNYMASKNDFYGEEFKKTLTAMTHNVQHFFVGSELRPYCCLVERNGYSRTYVEFCIEPITGDKKLHNIDYNKAYCMMQIKAIDTKRLVRILLNKKDPTVSILSFFEDCVYNDDNEFSLKHANIAGVFPLVKNLLYSVTAGVYMQNFLVNGSANIEDIKGPMIHTCVQ